jgi:hypothetical protein
MIKLFRKIRAKMSGTFVTDCPVCHKHFYGFQDYEEQVTIHHIHYRIICHECAGKKRNSTLLINIG